MARLKNRTTGVVVSVDDSKVGRLGSEWETLEGGNAPEGLNALKVAELREEIGRRNANRDEDGQLSAEGKKADLIATLEADDASSK